MKMKNDIVIGFNSVVIWSVGTNNAFERICLRASNVAAIITTRYPKVVGDVSLIFPMSGVIPIFGNNI
jgi:hypothetical protein